VSYKCETQKLGCVVDGKEVWTCIECGHERLYNFTNKRKCDVEVTA